MKSDNLGGGSGKKKLGMAAEFAARRESATQTVGPVMMLPTERVEDTVAP